MEEIYNIKGHYANGDFSYLINESNNCIRWCSPNTEISIECENNPFNQLFIKPHSQYDIQMELLAIHYAIKQIPTSVLQTKENGLWDLLFPGQPMIKPYKGAVEDFSGKLRKLIPDDMGIDLEEDIRKMNEES